MNSRVRVERVLDGRYLHIARKHLSYVPIKDIQVEWVWYKNGGQRAIPVMQACVVIVYCEYKHVTTLHRLEWIFLKKDSRLWKHSILKHTDNIRNSITSQSRCILLMSWCSRGYRKQTWGWQLPASLPQGVGVRARVEQVIPAPGGATRETMRRQTTKRLPSVNFKTDSPKVNHSKFHKIVNLPASLGIRALWRTCLCLM